MQRLMKIKILALIGCLFSLSNAFGQTDDFGIWTGLNFGFDVSKKTSLELNSCVRTFQNSGSIDLFYLEGGVAYKLFKRFSIAGYYRYIMKNEDLNSLYSRHRVYCDLKYAYPLSLLKFSLRLRLQGQYKTYWKNENDKLPDYYARLKATVNYNWPSLPVDPFISAELFHPLNAYQLPFVDKNRFSFGIQIKYSKKISIDLAYILDTDRYPRPARLNIIATDLNFSF
jgi:hypothetical protein